VYFSQTGNTKEAAEAAASECNVEAHPIEDEPDLSSYDLIIFGTPVHGGHPPKEMISYMKNLPELPGKRAATLLTHGGSGADTNTMSWMKKYIEDKGMEFAGGVSIMGEWKGFLRNKNVGRPNEEDLEKAKGFVKWLLGREGDEDVSGDDGGDDGGE
jgi:flavodoxin